MTSTTVVAPAPAAIRRRPAGRWEATGIAFVWILMFGPVLAVWIVSVVAIPLVLVTAGVILLLGAVPLMGVLANLHRRLAARVLGEDVPASSMIASARPDEPRR